MLRLHALGSILLLLGLAWSPARANADDRTGRDILPATSVVFVEMAKPAEVIRTLTTHPLLGEIAQLESYDKAMEKTDLLGLRLGVGFVELQIGMSWKDALTALTEGGIWASLNGPDVGNVLLVKARDEKTLNRIRDTLLKLARDDAKNKGQPEPFEEADYREKTVYKTKGGGFATIGPWLVLGDKPELGKAVLDNLIDGSAGGIAKNESFAAAQAKVPPAASVWAFANIATIRGAGVAPKLYSGRADDPGGEMLVGGILDVLKTANFSTTAFTVDAKTMSIEIALPFEADKVSESREFFFGPGATGRAPALPQIDGLLFGLSSYRDLSQMWLRAGDLFDESMNEKLAQADSQLTTLFSGKDFGEDILGAFAPQVQFVAMRQTFDEAGPVPSIKLPAFAIAFEMKDPDTARREFKRIFQSFVGFLNVVGAMNGQPQLELDIERDDKLELVSSSYLPEKEEATSKQARIQFNFSPSVGFQGKRFVLASTRTMARELAKAADSPASEVNTLVALNAGVLREVLNDNLSHLVSQNMLKEGATREEAELKLGDLLKILSFFRDARLQLGAGDGQLRASFQVQMLEPPAAAPASSSK